jgi:hypothetical protein
LLVTRNNMAVDGNPVQGGGPSLPAASVMPPG